MLELITEGFRLSPQQKRLWLLQHVEPSLPYQASCAVVIEGNLNAKVFKIALENLVKRHEILRTTFRCLPGMTIPLQVIADSSIPSVSDYDLSRLDPREQEARNETLFNEASRLSLDFEHGPLLRLSLVTLSPHRHVLLMSLPTLCADALTLGSLVREISRSYAVCSQGDQLTSEVMQYADIAEWQNDLLESAETETGREYWRKQDLSGVFALKLPFGNPTSDKRGFEPKFLSLAIQPDVVRQIETLVRKNDTSTYVFLLVCWQILLWRLTGQSDVIIGAGYDGRTHEELEGALGLLARYLPTRCHLNENFRFSEVLEQVERTTHEVLQWQECFSWEQIVEPTENAMAPAFFPVVFDFEERTPKHTDGDVSFSIDRQYVCIDRFKAKLSCVSLADSLTAEFHYDANLCRLEDIERLAGQFQTLLGNVLNDPEALISELSILSDVERRQLLVEWNDTEAEHRKNGCIHELFEEQAQRVPRNVAVVYENRQMTYAQLNSCANQLAHYLRRLGVGPEVRVGLCVKRSLEMIIGLLGVLKAGGAYVPLDPVLPQDRLMFMLEDAGVSLLLTQERLLDLLPHGEAGLVCLDTDWHAISRESEDDLISGVTSENLAYVLFTSGSTGKPKGVAVEHRQLLNYVDGILKRLDLPADATFATVSTLAADLGNTAIYPSLCTGGCLHVVSQERASDPDALAEYFGRYSIDCLKIVPSHLLALLNRSDAKEILPRKQLVLGGESSSWDLIKELQSLAAGCVILNHYGPTETTVGVLTYRLEKAQADSRSQTVPIGRPIPNVQIYLLDSHLRPVPVWVPGNVYIGGKSLARGYLNVPESTAENFIPNPFSKQPGTRLYKTGDFGRYLPDGNIEFLGRTDHQVKIRGFRIELGEIEAALRQHPGVQDTVVVPHEYSSSDKRLVAYVVLNQQPDSNELRGFLKSKLPDYMVPSAFVFLNSLPLTPNGKIDRKALPPPDQSSSDQSSYVAPRTPAENAIAAIWAELLKLNRVSVHDNFFELGGHSLLATQAISRLRNVFQAALPLRTLFETPTVAGLARYIDQSHSMRQHSPTSSNDTSENYEEIEL